MKFYLVLMVIGHSLAVIPEPYDSELSCNKAAESFKGGFLEGTSFHCVPSPIIKDQSSVPSFGGGGSAPPSGYLGGGGGLYNCKMEDDKIICRND